MKILIIPLSGGVGLGPLTRCLAVAKEAKLRNHQILFLCKDSFFPIVRKCGYLALLSPCPKSNGVNPPPYRLSDVAIALGWLNRDYLESAIRKELGVIRKFKPHVIFTETQFSVPISAALAKVPWAAATSWADHPKFKSPLFDDSQTYVGYEDRYNQILDKYNLPRIDDINELAYLRADLKIAPTIPQLQPELLQVPGVNFVGHLLSPDIEKAELPDSIKSLDGRNPIIYVYMSPGDILPQQWISTMVETFKNTKYQILISLAPLKRYKGKIPNIKNIQFHKFLPGSSVIKKSDLVITHGGGNTVTNALLYGKPMMIFSHFYAERDYNGRAVERLGAGMNFRTEKFNPKDILKNTENILRKNEFTKNAVKIGKTMKLLGGSKKTVDLLEKLGTSSVN